MPNPEVLAGLAFQAIFEVFELGFRFAKDANRAAGVPQLQAVKLLESAMFEMGVLPGVGSEEYKLRQVELEELWCAASRIASLRKEIKKKVHQSEASNKFILS